MLRFDFFSIAVIPPIVHWLPRPLRYIEHIIAEHGHALVETDRDAVYGCAHQCDSDNADYNSECCERRARQIGAHLCGCDFPTLAQFVEKTLHRDVAVVISVGKSSSGMNPA